jgi:hypothetical protein
MQIQSERMKQGATVAGNNHLRMRYLPQMKKHMVGINAVILLAL